MGKRFGGLKALSDVNLSVREGSCHAIIAPNGASKSTLRTIARLDDPAAHAGQIRLDGKPMHEMRAQQASTHGIQLVPEDRRIIPVSRSRKTCNWPRSPRPRAGTSRGCSWTNPMRAQPP